MTSDLQVRTSTSVSLSSLIVPFLTSIEFLFLPRTAWQIETVLGRVRNPSNPLNFVLERGFTLFDELWTPNNRETDESMVERAHLILSELFATESAQRA